MAGYITVFRSLSCKIMGESEKALQVRVTVVKNNTTYPKLVWFPKSQLSTITRAKGNDTGDNDDSILASEWVLKQKDMLNLTVQKAPSVKTDASLDDDIPF